MTRRTKLVTIDAEGRDKGKQFLLTELSAVDAQKWAIRVFLALAKSGAQVPDDQAKLGLAGLTGLGLDSLKGLDPDLAEPLIDKLLTCVKFQAPLGARDLVEDDIEEIMTLTQLQGEVLSLHLGFSMSDKLSNLTESVMSKVANLSTTPTSHPSLV